jgi:serine/threonine protein kinase
MWTKTGTPHYRSPELLKGNYTETTDIWSIGIIAYEMLTGRFPFRGHYDLDLVKAICSK